MNSSIPAAEAQQLLLGILEAKESEKQTKPSQGKVLRIVSYAKGKKK